MKKNSKPYVIVRCQNSSPFAGYLESQRGSEVTLSNARRLWYWDGACSLSELAVRGTAVPQNCKFPVAVPRVKLLDAIEIIECTEAGEKSIQEVKEWTRH